ncbi:MAG: hypothetical protein IPJ19_17815 [Planctomycetes bacterium]|nr:hypothetical protein [Planctomycetota bacterium]
MKNWTGTVFKELGGKTVVALLIPEAELAYRILALNTEKAHNLREKALEVIRMARDLARSDAGTDKDQALCSRSLRCSRSACATSRTAASRIPATAPSSCAQTSSWA